MKEKEFDLMWIVDAAGDDQKKLAQVSLLLAAAAIVGAQIGRSEETDAQMVGIVTAMEAIGKKMGLPPSEVMKKFRETVGKQKEGAEFEKGE
jgi:hypothetical protein